VIAADSTAFVALVKSMIPAQVHSRIEKHEKVEYRSFEEVLVELKASGLSDDNNLLLEDLR
jgi:hypothetical protein